MGEAATGTRINEAVNLISAIDAPKLDALALAFPRIRGELSPGIMAGDEGKDVEDWEYIAEKAQLITEAGKIAEKAGEDCRVRLRDRIVSANRNKLIVQLLTVVSSASVVGTLLTDQALAAKVTALITVIVSGAGVVVGQREKLMTGAGSIYEAYQKLTGFLSQLSNMSANLQLMIKYRRPAAEISELINKANGVLENINSLLPDIP
jgi:hypothetical protein